MLKAEMGKGRKAESGKLKEGFQSAGWRARKNAGEGRF